MKKGEVIIHPITTEKSTSQQEINKYCFKVNPRANKKEIMKAVNEVFGVEAAQLRLDCLVVGGNFEGALHMPDGLVERVVLFVDDAQACMGHEVAGVDAQHAEEYV